MSKNIRRTQWYDGIPSQGLLQDSVHIRERSIIGEVGKPSLTDSVDSFLCPSLNIGIEHHRKDERHKRAIRLELRCENVSGSAIDKGRRTVSDPAVDIVMRES